MSIFNPKDDKGGGGHPNPQVRVTIFTLASAYIMYLGFNMIRTAMREDPGMPIWAAWLIGIGFIAAGGFFLYTYLREYMRLRNAGPEEPEIEDTAPGEGETLPGGDELLIEENETTNEDTVPDEDPEDEPET